MNALASYILPVFLGLGLSAATGLRTFLPLLILALAAHFHLFGTSLNPHADWLASTPALIALAVATVAELAADKIPAVDHLLSLIGTVTRPVAGALAAGAVLVHADPWMAVIAGLIIGAPTALAFHSVQSGTRLASSVTTAGLANPLVSLAEDVIAAGITVVALTAPLLAAIGVALLLWLGFSVRDRLRSRTAAPQLPSR